MRPFASALTLLLAFATSPLLADCEDVSGNLITNCSFDSATTGWTVDSGTPSHDDGNGNPNMVSLLNGSSFHENGAILITSNFLVRVAQCVNVATPGIYDFFFAYNADNGTEETCRVRVHEYQTAGCPSGTQVDTAEETDGAINGWESMAGQITLDPGVASARLEAECIGVGSADASAHFDDGVLRFNQVPVELQRFRVD